MPHDPYASFLGCRNRTAECHANCDGYQSREQEKQIAYALRETLQSAVPDHAGYKAILNKRARHAQLKGR
jgi:hypothetical protein